MRKTLFAVLLCLCVPSARAELILCANQGAGVYHEECVPISCREAAPEDDEADRRDADQRVRPPVVVASWTEGCGDEDGEGTACTVTWSCW